ncbi:MAG: 50S ribosomal protein L4 [Acholeplasmataceae bacterium]|nr:MAG: 50S ribosomal protein L4 [Acholeplasmataceae bacterium]
MPKVNILNLTGQKVAELNLSDHVFGIEPHQQALYDVVQAQRAAMRQGTHDVKGRSDVRGGGRRPWRQKGTGRARHGTIRSPLWRGGGVTFGPTPRSYAVKMNQKVRQLALRSALSYHAANGQMKVIEALNITEPKTKVFGQMLKDLGVEGKTLIIATSFTDNDMLSARNIPTVSFAQVDHVSVYDLLNSKQVIMTKDAVQALEEVLGND